METAQTTIPAATPQVTPPVTQPAFVQPQPYISPEQLQDGGTVSQQKFDYVELGFMIFGVTALCFVVYYYIQKAKQSKQMAASAAALEKRMASAEAKLSVAMRKLGIAA